MATCMRIPFVVLASTLLLSACATTPHKDLTATSALQKHAQQAYLSGDMNAAQADYLQLTQTMPNDTRYWFRLGNVYARSGQLQRAVHAYRHVLKHDADHAKAWHNLGIVLMQQAEAAFMQSASKARANDGLKAASLRMEQKVGRLLQGPGPAQPQQQAAREHGEQPQ